MKTIFGLPLAVCLMVAGAPMLLSAAGGGATGAAVGGGGGGGHGGAVASTGGGHVSSAPAGGVHGGSFSTGGMNGGSRSFGVGAGRPAAMAFNGAPRYVSGGFTTSNTGRANLTMAQASGGNVNVARTTPVVPAARVHNAWTDPAPNGAAGLGQRNGGNDRRNADNFTGQVLYPNAGRGAPGDRRLPGPGYLAGAVNNNGGRHEFRSRYRGYYGNGYGFGYPGVFVGGYDPSFYGGTVGDYAGADLSGFDNGDIGPAPAMVAAISPPIPAGDSTVQPPADPAAAGGDDASQQQPAAPASNVQSNNGPDSLVEAVQAELSRRGYFGGKIDAVYNDATHAAIQRFQRDQKLPASGRINEATLHALQLD